MKPARLLAYPEIISMQVGAALRDAFPGEIMYDDALTAPSCVYCTARWQPRQRRRTTTTPGGPAL